MDPSEHDAPPVPVAEGESTPHATVTDAEPTARQDSQMSDTVFTPIVESKGGMQMPRLGFGTFQLEPDTAERMVAEAIEVGYRHIDTAQMYQNEEAVGKGLVASGVSTDEIFVTTKVDNDNHEPEALVESVEASLEKLQLDHVDLLLVHWPVHYDRIAATVAALANVHAGGMTRHIGVSNFTIEQLEQVKGMAPIEALQVECHPYFQQRELLDWCVENDFALTAYSPVAQGKVFDDDVLSEIAEAHGSNPGAVALAWLMQRDHVCAIPRTSSSDHLADNFAAVELELGDDEIARIDDLDDAHGRIVSPPFAPWAQ